MSGSVRPRCLVVMQVMQVKQVMCIVIFQEVSAKVAFLFVGRWEHIDSHFEDTSQPQRYRVSLAAVEPWPRVGSGLLQVALEV